ncbi:hypothetical protein VL21_08905 [Stenotrophomonas maltophilia]|nr:hypothetical protein VL21_08905 [Stenotrophomonas maltophilia]
MLGLLGAAHLLFGQFHRVLQVPQGLGRPAQALGELVFALQPCFASIAVVAGIVPGPSGLLEVSRRLVSYDEGQLGFSLSREVVPGQRAGQGISMVLSPSQGTPDQIGHVFFHLGQP